jgi:uncharacterized protein
MGERVVIDAEMKQDPRMARLGELLRELGRVAIAFSGGVDSTFLAAVAGETLGRENVLLVTAISETYAARERAESETLAELLGLERIVIDTHELEIPEFRHNPPDRCYYCKKELFTQIREVVAGRGKFVMCDGSNTADTHDFRPGRRAVREQGVRSPLLEAGLSKDDIRELSRSMGLPTWNKPAYACLSSRFPYGTDISPEMVERVGACEEELIQLGFPGSRVRHHGDVARIEVPPERVAELAAPEMRRRVVERFKALGYKYVTLDLQGYRTGSMNEVLSDEIRLAEGEKPKEK